MEVEAYQPYKKKSLFEPTYKEWKYISLLLQLFLFYRFEPTYKEWKLYRFPVKKRQEVGFEPTYKEWKSSQLI